LGDLSRGKRKEEEGGGLKLDETVGNEKGKGGYEDVSRLQIQVDNLLGMEKGHSMGNVKPQLDFFLVWEVGVLFQVGVKGSYLTDRLRLKIKKGGERELGWWNLFHKTLSRDTIVLRLCSPHRSG